MADQSRAKNPNWRGGRSVASSGYVLVRVGKDHHLADVRGYAYEHRIVAERKLGRQLLDGEVVHHINEDKTDNRPENIKVAPSIAHHLVEHRHATTVKRMPDEPNPAVACACGCGELFAKYDDHNRPRRFVTGHNVGVRR